MLDEVLEKIPETFNMAEIMAKAAEKTPYVVVAFQECERMNILTNEMRRSLKELNLGLKVRKIRGSRAPGMRLRKWAGRRGLAHRLICKPNQPPSPAGALALGTARHCPPPPPGWRRGRSGTGEEATQAVPCRRRWRGHPRWVGALPRELTGQAGGCPAPLLRSGQTGPVTEQICIRATWHSLTPKHSSVSLRGN